MLLGLVVILGGALGCSGGGVAEAQPKPANPDMKPNIHRAGANQGVKAVQPIQD
jgi:hypothetical protein